MRTVDEKESDILIRLLDNIEKAMSAQDGKDGEDFAIINAINSYSVFLQSVKLRRDLNRS